MTEFIGWAAAAILLITIIKQVHKQWQTETNEGVSKWLFVGQVASSVGFTVYSALKGDWVFIVTNAVLLLSNIAGVVIYFKNREKESVSSETDPAGGFEFNRKEAGGEKA